MKNNKILCFKLLVLISFSLCVSSCQQAKSASQTSNSLKEIGLETEDCFSNPRATQPELNICAQEKFLESEEVLREFLEILNSDIPERLQQQLASNQEIWTGLKEQECEWVASFFEGGSMASMQQRLCMAAYNQKRIDFLNNAYCMAWASDDRIGCDDILR